ncbi:MAG: CBS domain-containing protein [Chloroflexia bacterium]
MTAVGGGVLTVVDVAAYRYRHPNPAEDRRRSLKVRQIMETQPVTVGPETPVAVVLPLLLNKFYKALPVVDAERRVLGMVTDRDLLEKADLGIRVSVLEALREHGQEGFAEIVRAMEASGKTARDVMGSRPEAVIGPHASVEAAHG